MGLFDFLKPKKKGPEPGALSYDEIVKLLEAARLKESAAAQKTPPARPAAPTPPVKPVPVYDEAARLREVAGITDDKALIEIIQFGNDTDAVKQAAIKALKDQSLLVDVIQWTAKRANTANSKLKALIIKNITDQDVLIRISGSVWDSEQRKSILLRIRDLQIVKNHLLSDKDLSFEIEKALIRKIKVQEDLAEISRDAKASGIRELALQAISDENILREIISKNPIAFTHLTAHFKKKGFEELVGILEDIKAKDAAMKKAGGYICSACSGENPPQEDGTVSCVCRHCGAENHDWEYVDKVTEYRDYAVGCTYYECKRCKAQKDYRSVNTTYLE